MKFDEVHLLEIQDDDGSFAKYDHLCVGNNIRIELFERMT